MGNGIVTRILRNDEVLALVAEIPEGHQHLRTTLT